jgi:exopolysaccharide biosynthesis polyprenyl glycosylphosphotransferase
MIRLIGKKRAETEILLFMDFFSLSFANSFYYYFRVRSGFFRVITIPDFWGPVIVLTLFLMSLYWLWGLYKFSYLDSRLDETIAVGKASTLGVLLLFFLIFFDDASSGRVPHVRALVIFYECFIVLFVGGTRIAFRTFQKKLLLKGIGLRSAIIVGSGERACSVFNLANKYRSLGYKPIGFVGVSEDSGTSKLPAPLLSDVSRLNDVISTVKATEVIIALEENEKGSLNNIISAINGADVSIKIVPDLYDSIAGQAHATPLRGFPLIDVVPQLMPPWQMTTKRIIDVAVSSLALVFGFPIWIVIAMLIKFDSKGPVIYKQERVGKDGHIFTLYKFRSMCKDAEQKTGPVWALKNDPRVTRVGRFLRKTHLDEVPQFFNVLKGEMSLVGPRPEREYFVEKLSKEIPLYKRRLKVKPGLTGLSRVKYKYDESVEDVKIDLQYDLFYIENMSLRLDFQILFQTIFHVLLGKGHA